jgi:pimeloyl-ACP methyl ester carboxylesterase
MSTPFKVEWSPRAIDKVRAQVRAYEFPVAPEGEFAGGGWNHGCDAETLKRLTAYWADGFDVAGAVDNLNRFPQFTAKVEGLDVHFVHVVGEAGGKRPLLLTHGWPGSHFEFWDAIEPLAFPSRFGGDPADAFDLVIPSLPGFGFSGKPNAPIGQRATARLFNTLMTQELGYDRYLAQGGDWGSVVTSWLGLDHAAHVKAIHLNMIGFRPHGPPKDEAEIAWIQRTAFAMDAIGAYLRLQVSKPQSLAWLGANNPVGQAAWILERFHDWADLTSKPFEEVFSPDKLLTNIMLYAMTGSFTTGAWYYRGDGRAGIVRGGSAGLGAAPVDARRGGMALPTQFKPSKVRHGCPLRLRFRQRRGRHARGDRGAGRRQCGHGLWLRDRPCQRGRS